MFQKALIRLHHWFRIYLYKCYSDNNNIHGKFISGQPVVFKGQGHIFFGNNVRIGVRCSPHYYNSYAYIDSRSIDSKIRFGNNISINNSFSIVSEKEITIGNNVLIGFNCCIIDSNFHNLDTIKRKETDPNPEDVIIGDNVFIGNDVTILKGVTLGENTVVAARAVVTKSFPKNVVIGGNPAKIIGQL